jgi:hypothetical protein
LATDLASQPNAESYLCPHLTPATKRTALEELEPFFGAKILAKDAKREQEYFKAERELMEDDDEDEEHTSPAKKGSAEGSDETSSQENPSSATDAKDKTLNNKEDAEVEELLIEMQLGRESMLKLDRRSFIQNFVNTDAFRMLEWLTPSKLDGLAGLLGNFKNMVSGSSAPAVQAKRSNWKEEFGSDEASDPSSLAAEAARVSAVPLDDPRHARLPHSTAAPEPIEAHKNVARNSPPEIEKSRKSTSPLVPRNRRRSDLRPSPPTSLKSINNPASPEVKIRETSETDLKTLNKRNSTSFTDENTFQRRISTETQPLVSARKPRRRVSIASTTKLTFSADEKDFTSHSDQSSTSKQTTSIPTPTLENYISGEALEMDIANTQKCDGIKPSPKSSKHISAEPEHHFPQSLTLFTVSTISLLDKWFAAPGTLDPHRPFRNLLGPEYRIDDDIELKPMKNAKEWIKFIEQSVFYVLSDKKTLMKSFFNDDSGAIDTLTLFSCMRSLIAITPNTDVIFDSLWVAAKCLFVPPECIADGAWDKHGAGVKDGIRGKRRGAVTSEEAVRVASVCLHALIAAVPYFEKDNTLLFAGSRERSNGILISNKRQEPGAINIKLRLNDAFTDEMVMRLALRFFAGISAQQRFQELSRLNGMETPSKDKFLDAVLKPLKYLDAQTPSEFPSWTDEQREVHEKRAPLLMLDWARAVMIREWRGKPTVPADGPFGGALALISALCMYSLAPYIPLSNIFLDANRNSLLIPEVFFQTEYFEKRLNIMEMPVEWLSIRCSKNAVHLLDYPFLFSPDMRVNYLRAINFSRMSSAYDSAETMSLRMHAITSTLVNDQRHQYLNDALRVATSKFLLLHVKRDKVLRMTFDQLWRREERELLRPLKVELVEFGGDEGTDLGGVQVEFFRMVMAEAMNPDFGAFTVDDRTRMIWFQPSSPEPLWKFELIGLIVSLAVYNGLAIPVTFPKALYRKLLGAPVTELHHIEDGWPDLASGLTALLEWDESNGKIEDVFCRTYEFSVNIFDKDISRDMRKDCDAEWPAFKRLNDNLNPPDAPVVDASNRNDFVTDYINYLTDISVAPQYRAFAKGFNSCLNPKSLQLLSPELLQSLVEGIHEISIPELERYTRYTGWNANHPSVIDFWSIVREYNDEQKRKLLEFVTASDRVPVGGMKNIQFVVQKNGSGIMEERLPTSYTCYGILLLPDYRDREKMKRKLDIVLGYSTGFGFA